MRHVSWILCVGFTGCSLVFGSQRHTSGDAGPERDAPILEDGGGMDTPAPLDAPAPLDTPVLLDAPCVNVDLDGDGFGTCDGDCDDANPDRYPGAAYCDNGIIDSCPGWNSGELGSYFSAAEVGFSIERFSVNTAVDQLGFALTPSGGLYATISAVVAVTDGTSLRTEWRVQNFVRPDIVSERGLRIGSADYFFGTPRFVPNLLALAPAYDGYGDSVWAGLFRATDSTLALRELDSAAINDPIARTAPGGGGALSSAMVTNGFGSHAATHVHYSASPARFTSIDAQAGGFTTRTITGFSPAAPMMRSASDGTVLVQDGAAPGRMAIFVAEPVGGAAVYTLDATGVTGPLAPLGGGATTGVTLYESTAGLSLGRLDCSATICSMVEVAPAWTGTDPIVAIAGAPLPNTTRTARSGVVGLAAIRTGASDRLTLVIADTDGVSALPAVTLPHALGGQVIALRVEGSTDVFRFHDGAEFTRISVVGFAALVDGPTGREVVVGSVRACGAR